MGPRLRVSYLIQAQEAGSEKFEPRSHNVDQHWRCTTMDVNICYQCRGLIFRLNPKPAEA